MEKGKVAAAAVATATVVTATTTGHCLHNRLCGWDMDGEVKN